MGTNTNGYVKSDIKIGDVYEVILSLFDKDAKIFIQNNGSDRYNSIGNIAFRFKDENRFLFVIEATNCESCEKDYCPFKDNKYTYLSLGMWGKSNKIMYDIVKSFGGYIDEDDCDSVDWVDTYIKKESDVEFDSYTQQLKDIKEIVGSYEVAKIIINKKDELIKFLK